MTKRLLIFGAVFAFAACIGQVLVCDSTAIASEPFEFGLATELSVGPIDIRGYGALVNGKAVGDGWAAGSNIVSDCNRRTGF